MFPDMNFFPLNYALCSEGCIQLLYSLMVTTLECSIKCKIKNSASPLQCASIYVFLFFLMNSKYVLTELSTVGLANEKPVFSVTYELNLYIKDRFISASEVLNCVSLKRGFAELLLKTSLLRSVTLYSLGNIS